MQEEALRDPKLRSALRAQRRIARATANQNCPSIEQIMAREAEAEALMAHKVEKARSNRPRRLSTGYRWSRWGSKTSQLDRVGPRYQAVLPRCRPERYVSIDGLFDGRSDAQVKSDSDNTVQGAGIAGNDADMKMARIVHDMIND